MENVRLFLEQTVQQQSGRILTQACRDPHAQGYGCFDRNWWHYRVRDFPSIILQQGGYFCALLAQPELNRPHRDSLLELAVASVDFWHSRAVLRGAFEEYYPWEKGYPPLAFSTLGVMKIMLMAGLDKNHYRKGISIAAKQLLSRVEKRAANQQVAGLAALTCIRGVYPELVPEYKYHEIRKFTLALQHSEGWFVEYEGPDLGYLSVTLDCLWDLWDQTHDPEILQAGRSALGFMHRMIRAAGGSIGLLNSRDTDYLVPYGILRFTASDDQQAAAEAAEIMKLVFNDKAGFVADAIDDRYWTHYIGHSFARALLFFYQHPEIRQQVTSDGNGRDLPDIALPGAGYFVKAKSGITCLIAARKGGSLMLVGKGGSHIYYCDFGWLVKLRGDQYVTHWGPETWDIGEEGGRITVSGRLFLHREQISTPLKHFFLRMISFFLGYRIIGILKNLLIFKKRRSSIGFTRIIDFQGRVLLLEDTLTNVPAGAAIFRAPRSSKRHVASAGLYHPEDFSLCEGFLRVQTESHEEQTYRYKTTCTVAQDCHKD